MKRIISLLFIFNLLIIGCSEQTVTKQPSELILELSDLPDGYSVKEKTPRLKSDVSPEAANWGWKEGYYVRYARINGDNIFDNTIIEQHLSVYPIENIEQVIDTPYDFELVTLEELPSPSIGDKSKAYRITVNNELLGVEERSYKLEFIKKNVYENFLMSGTATDYELLLSLAKKAEAKIK